MKSVFTYTNPRCPLTGRILPADPVAQFWNRVVKTATCWIWTGGLSRGYGQIKYLGKRTRAHRVSWEMHNGPIPDGLQALHKCDNKICVNPAHLFLGTIAENMADKQAKNRQVFGEKHGRAKLTSGDVRSIRSLRVNGTGVTALSRKFGVCKTTVEKIIGGKLWKRLV